MEVFWNLCSFGLVYSIDWVWQRLDIFSYSGRPFQYSNKHAVNVFFVGFGPLDLKDLNLILILECMKSYTLILIPTSGCRSTSEK